MLLVCSGTGHEIGFEVGGLNTLCICRRHMRKPSALIIRPTPLLNCRFSGHADLAPVATLRSPRRLRHRHRRARLSPGEAARLPRRWRRRRDYRRSLHGGQGHPEEGGQGLGFAFFMHQVNCTLPGSRRRP